MVDSFDFDKLNMDDLEPSQQELDNMRKALENISAVMAKLNKANLAGLNVGLAIDETKKMELKIKQILKVYG